MKSPKITRGLVRTFRERLFCPEDDTELIFDGQVLATSPPKYMHHCPICEYSIAMHNVYPKISYEGRE